MSVCKQIPRENVQLEKWSSENTTKKVVSFSTYFEAGKSQLNFLAISSST